MKILAFQLRVVNIHIAKYQIHVLCVVVCLTMWDDRPNVDQNVWLIQIVLQIWLVSMNVAKILVPVHVVLTLNVTLLLMHLIVNA